MKIRFFAAALALCLAVVARGQCTPRFVAGYDFGRLRSTSSSQFDSIFAAAVFDDHSGTGPALFIGGYLSVLGQQGGGGSWMAKLVGDHWVAIPGFDGPPRCMGVFDDGSGPALYVGGSFTAFPGGTGCLAKWNGTTWTGLGLARNNLSGAGIYALVRHDDGQGMSLFAGGLGFAMPDQPNPSLVMRYDGATWHSLDAGGWQGSASFDPTAVRTMVVFDDGNGPRLYAGGSFNMTPNGASNCVAVWNGTTWFPAGGGLASQGVIKCLAVHQGTLFAAGDSGGGPGGIWRRNGALWELSYGSNADYSTRMGATTLLSYDDGTGPALYAMVGSDSHRVDELAVYSNGTWTAHGPPMSNDDGSSQPTLMTTLLLAPTTLGTNVVTVGKCTGSGTAAVPNVGAWVNGAWHAVEVVGNGLPSPAWRVVYDPETDDGSVYIANRRYTAAGWTPTTLPLAYVNTMLRLHHGGLSSLVIGRGGQFMTNSGAGWQPLPSLGLTGCVGVLSDSSGESLVAVYQGSVPYTVRQLVGSTWASLGSPFGGSRVYLHANRLITYDSGFGPKLYLGGVLRVASNGAPTSYLAYFDNGQWVQVPGVPGQVLEMCVYDVGSGPELILACTWNGVIGSATGGVYRWNGSRIDSVGTWTGTVDVAAMLPFDDGTGVHLWASWSGNPLGSLLYWDGTAWRGYPGLVGSSASSLAPALRPDRSHSLMLGGAAVYTGDVISSGIAELATCPRTCTADFNGDGDSGTDVDIEAFLACVAGNCCALCGSADFNNDGDSATDADIESFFRVLAGGTC